MSSRVLPLTQKCFSAKMTVPAWPFLVIFLPGHCWSLLIFLGTQKGGRASWNSSFSLPVCMWTWPRFPQNTRRHANITKLGCPELLRCCVFGLTNSDLEYSEVNLTSVEAVNISWFVVKHCFFFLIFNVYLFLRDGERQSVSGGGAERERARHRIWSRLQALICQHRARRGSRSHEPWDHDLSRSWMFNRLSLPGTPIYLFWDRERRRENPK